MKVIVCSILFLLCGPKLMAHGGHMAVFKYHITATSIVLEFQIERSILQHFDLQRECNNYETATAWCLVQYINSKNHLNINDKEVRFELESSKQDEDFFLVRLTAQGDFADYKNIVLSNKCFLEFDQKFENRIIIEQQDAVRSFLLDHHKTDITID